MATYNVYGRSTIYVDLPLSLDLDLLGIVHFNNNVSMDITYYSSSMLCLVIL